MKALILNYGIGNIYSISSALKHVDFDVTISNMPRYNYDLIVLPGVGSSKALSHYIEENGSLLRDVIDSGIYVLGICLGMQILFEYSFEYGYIKGLGILDGYVDKISTRKKIPHIGWDRIYTINKDSECSVFEEIHREYVYFMHSYIVYPSRVNYICTISLYDAIFPASIANKNIFGVQFHPEKSGNAGYKFIRNLARMIRR